MAKCIAFGTAPYRCCIGGNSGKPALAQRSISDRHNAAVVIEYLFHSPEQSLAPGDPSAFLDIPVAERTP